MSQTQSSVKWIIPEKVQVVLNSKFTQDIKLPPIFCSLLWQNSLAYKHTTENDCQVRGKDRELEHCLAMLRVQIALRIYVYRSWFSHSVSYKTDLTMRYSFKKWIFKIHFKKEQKDWKDYEACYPKFHRSRGKTLFTERTLSFLLKWKHVIIIVI